MSVTSHIGLSACPLGEACRRLRCSVKVVVDEFSQFFRASRSEILSLVRHYEAFLAPLETRFDSFHRAESDSMSPGPVTQELSVFTLNIGNLVSEKSTLATAIAGIAAAHAALRGGGSPTAIINHNGENMGGLSGNNSGNFVNMRSPRGSPQNIKSSPPSEPLTSLTQARDEVCSASQFEKPPMHLEEVEY